MSRGLIQECYAQLLSEGYLTSQTGSATRVAAGAQPAAARPSPVLPSGPRLIADFRPGVPDLASFPRGDWARAVREACTSAANADLDYGDPRGSLVLREVLAGYLRRVRAADADAARLIACTGFAQGLVLVLQALARTGVAVRRVRGTGLRRPGGERGRAGRRRERPAGGARARRRPRH